MRQASKRIPESAEKTVRDIRRATRRHHSAEEKDPASCWKACVARTALLSCAARKGSIRNLYYRWSKEFLEAGKKRLDTMPSSSSLQAWAKTVGPSPSICSLNRMPGPALASTLASVALRATPLP